MGIAYALDAKAKLVRLSYAGSVTIDDLEDVMEAVFKHPDYQPGFGFLVDRRHTDPPTDEYIEDAAGFGMTNEKRLAGARWAVVLADDALEAAKRGVSLAKRADIPAIIQLFREVDAAEDWLRLTSST